MIYFKIPEAWSVPAQRQWAAAADKESLMEWRDTAAGTIEMVPNTC